MLRLMPDVVDVRALDRAGTWIKIHGLLVIALVAILIVLAASRGVAIATIMVKVNCNAPHSAVVKAVREAVKSMGSLGITMAVYGVLSTCVWVIIAAIPLALLARATKRYTFWPLVLIIVALAPAALIFMLQGEAYAALDRAASSFAEEYAEKMCETFMAILHRGEAMAARELEQVFGRLATVLAGVSMKLLPATALAQVAAVVLGIAYISYRYVTSKLRNLGLLIIASSLLSLASAAATAAGVTTNVLGLLSLIIEIVVIVYCWITGSELKRISRELMEARQLEEAGQPTAG